MIHSIGRGEIFSNGLGESSVRFMDYLVLLMILHLIENHVEAFPFLALLLARSSRSTSRAILAVFLERISMK